MLSRRRFLKKALASSTALACSGALGLQLSAMKAFASQARFDDHKALVCVFLYGGNDSFNMLIPRDPAEYRAYQNTRQNIAYADDALLDITIRQNEYSPHALPNTMTAVQSMFNHDDIAIVANIGPLVEPVSKQALLADARKLPPQLFSHNSQQALWQSAGTNAQLAKGWLGKMADLLQDTNTSLPMNIGIGSSDILSTGDTALPLVLDPSGPEDFSLLNPSNRSHAARLSAHNQLLELANLPKTREYAKPIDNARHNNEILKAALSAMPARVPVYPQDNGLGAQLNMVADMISVQNVVGQSRQVFFVGLGGWDTHDNQAELHPVLLATLSDALGAFKNDLQNMGKFNDVATVTLSEFGRTLTSNKDGTDHGWAGHQLLMGGAVDGGKIHGHLPTQEIGTADDWDDGRIIPTTSVEQLGASLASWFGLSATEIRDVFPGIDRFNANALELFKR